MLPEYSQARKAIWNATNPHTGQKRIDEAFPPEIRSYTRDNEMIIGFHNNSTWQVVGSDNYDSLMGTSFAGLVMSEFALGNPSAWGYFSPILMENNGWAVFISTPRGKNHFYNMMNTARKHSDWFAEVSTAETTGVFTKEQLDSELERLIDTHGSDYGRALWMQEYFCLHPSTKVLKSDLTWVTMSELCEGDELIGVDEHSSKRTTRKLRPSIVTKRWETEKTCYKITVDDGREIISSLEHPWLTKQKPSKRDKTGWYVWRETKDLEIGMDIADIGLRPWEEEKTYDAGYLAGFYDGEGCVSRATVQSAQKNGPVWDKVKQLLSRRKYTYYTTSSKGIESIHLGLHDSLRFLGTIRPERLLRKARSIWNGRFPFNLRKPARIISIEDVGMQPVVGISTSTHTFIAEGLVTHNCSFDAAIPGSIWGDAIARCEREGRICEYDVDPNLPVYTAWDLGRTDDTSIWFYQFNGKYIDVFDCFSKPFMDINNPDEPQKGLVQLLLEKAKKYNVKYATNNLPHDARPRTLAAGGKSILQQLNDCRDKNPVLGKFAIIPRLDKQEGIQAARKTFPYVRFHSRCEPGIEALKYYHREWDEETRTFSDNAAHDWSSHACLVSGSMVRTKNGFKPIETIMVGDSVWTPSGYSKVLHAGVVKKAVSLIKIDTEKTTLTCTPEHKILTKRGFVTADTLRYNDYIFTGEEWSCALSSLISMALNIGFRAVITGETTGRIPAPQICIGQYGSFIMEKFQKATTSIISTGIRSITKLKTSILFSSQSIEATIQSRIINLEYCGLPVNWLWKEPQNGTNQKKDCSTIRNWGRFLGKTESQRSASVSIVKKSISRRTQYAQNFAAHTAKIILGLSPMALCLEAMKNASVRNVAKNLCLLFLRGSNTAHKIVRLTRIEGDKASQLVYDLTVEKNACYQANGFLVSNSDAFRYLSLSWKIPKQKSSEIITDLTQHTLSNMSFGNMKKQHLQRMRESRQ